MASSPRLDELKKKFDENPRRYFAPLANEYRKLGDLIQAIALCRTHLPNQPGHISGHIVLAQALYESRELSESRESFEAALDLDPENLIALRYLGDIAREEGTPAVAIAWYQRVLDADPRNDEISQLLRQVQAEEAASRSELASRPTPPTVMAVADEPEAPAAAAVPLELDEHFALDTADLVESPTVAESDTSAPESFELTVADALEMPSADELRIADTPELAPASDSERESSDSTHEPVEAEIEPFELPAFEEVSDAAPAPAPTFDAALDEDPFFAQDAMGEFEAVAEPTLDDWFATEPEPARPAAVADADAFLPDLSAAAELPAASGIDEPSVASLPDVAELDEPFQVEALEAAAPADVVEMPVEAAAFVDDMVDPESDTIEFTIESVATSPVDESPEAADMVAADVPLEASFEPAPWFTAESSDAALAGDDVPAAVDDGAPMADRVSEAPVEAPSYEWSAESEPAEDVRAWADAPTTEMPSAWESALAPDQLAPVSEVPVEREPNPLLGRTPRFEQAIPEEAPPAPFVTETMAELYLQQGFTEEGLAIYRELLRQSPGDESLQRRVAALESGGESSVLDAASESPSVRAFFARFATRPRRARVVPNEHDGSRFGGVASTDEAMTQPDEPASLTEVFSSRAVSTADAQAAATLASAFGIPSASDVAGDEGELSLGHLFRDVEAHSGGAVTSAGFADSADGAETRQASDVESHADIEQFTAWLEGLKKK